MTLKNGRPYCDECRCEMIALSEQQALDSMMPCGWTNYRTAHKHVCNSCYDTLFERWADEVGFPACGECRTRPCEHGRECWDHRDPPVHWFPYDTYFSDLVGRVEYLNLVETEDEDFDNEEPVPEQVRRRQKLIVSAAHLSQSLMLDFLEKKP